MRKLTLYFCLFLLFMLCYEWGAHLFLPNKLTQLSMTPFLEKSMQVIAQHFAPAPLQSYFHKKSQQQSAKDPALEQDSKSGNSSIPPVIEKRLTTRETKQNHIRYINKQQEQQEKQESLTNQNKEIWDPTPIVIQVQSLLNIHYDLFLENNPLERFKPALPQLFPSLYTQVNGVLTFRGNHQRTAPVFGFSDIKKEKLVKQWDYTTKRSSWGGGAGWTGQPAIVQWPDEIKSMMNIFDEYKGKKNFVEVIYASLDGSVYFSDLETGKPSRPPLVINNPIKGSVSIDPRGYPLMYVGEGIPEQKEVGFGLYSLIDHKRLAFIKGKNNNAFREWGAFDSSALINRETDTLYVGGENGLFYTLQLNTTINLEKQTMSIDPVTTTYRYRTDGLKRQGIEGSIAAYKNLAFFADNSGGIQALDLQTLTPIWVLPPTDDTDASITLEVENDIPYLYTGTEVDHQGSRGNAILRKINGLSGDVIWEVTYPCFTDPDVNGGMLATNIIGKHAMDHLAVFTIARYKKLNSGLMIAIDKQSGQEVWRWEMPNYAWSSPVDLYTSEGKAYLIQCDSAGMMTLLNGATGKIVDQLSLGANIEASPAVFQDMIIVATRGQKVYGIRVE